MGKVWKTNISYAEIMNMKKTGMTYSAIAKLSGVSRQRIQQIVRPPKNKRMEIIETVGKKCQRCGSVRGLHFHHLDYSDNPQLELLCVKCHRIADSDMIGRSPKKKMKKLPITNTSGYRGIFFHKSSGLWGARLRVGGKEISGRYFRSKIDAARAYDELAKKYKGDRAVLNFNESTPMYKR